MATTNNDSDASITHRTYSDFELGGIYYLSKAGHSKAEIQRLMNIPYSTITDFLRRYEERQTTERSKGPKQKPKLDERTIRHLKQFISRDPLCTYNDLKRELEDCDVYVCRQTVINTLKREGYSSYVAARKPQLTKKHKERRLKWAKDHVNWTDDQWKNVMWSDESKFTAGGHAGAPRVIRKEGQRYDAKNVVSTTKWGVGSVMVWGCFWGGGFGPLWFFEKSVDQDEYIDCLSKNYIHWANALSEEVRRDFILQEDGASIHTGTYSTWWKKRWLIKSFDYWPAQSPDLNPIENVWGLFKNRVGKRRSEVKSVEKLKEVLREEWDKLSVEYAEKLVGGMKKRCEAVIKANGGITRY